MDDTPRSAQDSASDADGIKQNPADPAATSKPEASNGAKASEAGAGSAAGTTTQEVSLESQLTSAQAKADEYLDGWQRARAEFANYRKRIEKERDELYQNATVDTLRKLFPIIDDFDRAVSNLPADKVDDEIIKGFTLIHRKLLTTLDSAGIKVINPVGEEFNPAFHEAIGHDTSSDVPSGHVTMVLQKGYVQGDKVLRPALVRVAQ